MRRIISLGLAIGSLAAMAFHPHPAASDAPTAELRLSIVNTFGPEPVRLNHPYPTLSGDVVELTRYGYYLSNVQLRRPDGSRWQPPRGYYLFEADEAGTGRLSITLPGVPAGEYHEVDFAVGLDSLSNHGGQQQGVLNPDFGMFWEWEASYVFLKCEGFSGPAGSPQRKALVYHVARNANYRPVRLPLPAGPLKLVPGSHSTVEITADARRLFGGFPGAGLTLHLAPPDAPTSIMTGPHASGLADNYARMFSISE
jgi:hypothetical protein